MVLNGSKISKITLTVSLLFFGLSCNTLAQQPVSERTITINMSASELLPANQIIFNININAEADTPQEAFEIHKKREAVLAELLKEFEIEESDINYQPVRMHKQQRNEPYRSGNGEKSEVIVTRQTVSVTFSDFSAYEDIQVTLIENDFNSFSGQFSSSEISEGKQKALIKAIEAAKVRAELIAKTSGFKLGPVSSINYSDHEIGSFKSELAMEYSGSMARNDSMMDFGQTVEVRANINISYSIQ